MSDLLDQAISRQAGQLRALHEAGLRSLALRRAPHPGAYFERARLYLQRGDYEKALANLVSPAAP
jgi:hypothetical protein